MSETTKPIRPPGLAPEVMTVEEAWSHLGISKTRLYGLMRDGTIARARSLGRRALVTTASVEAAKAAMLGVEAPRPVRARRRRSSGEALTDAFALARKKTG